MKRGENFCQDVGSLVTEIKTVFDVGANIGAVTKQLRDFFGSANIYSFEPIESTFAMLINNTEDLEGIECYNIGFSDRSQIYKVFLQPDSGWNSIEKNYDSGRGSVQITTQTVDEFCAAKGIQVIDLLKTDTEGHDLHVLRGAQSMLWEQRIKSVYTEVGFYREDKGHTNICDLLDFMHKNDFQLFGIYGIASTFIDDNQSPDYPWANALFASNSIVRAKYGAAYFEWLAGIFPEGNS